MKDLSIKEFANKIKQELMLFYSDYRIDISEAVKNNAVLLTGITIMSADCNIAPIIYINEFYDEYQRGRPFMDICTEIKSIKETEYPESAFDVEEFERFDIAREKICYKLVNAEKNASLLQEIPHRIYHDLAIVYYLLVSQKGDGAASILINDKISAIWNTDEEQLHKLAKENTPRLLRGHIAPIWDVLTETVYENTDSRDWDCRIASCDMIVTTESDMPLHVATNSAKFHGAAIALYDDVLDSFATKVGGDFFILPSSIHEMLFIPAMTCTKAETLIEMVREINTEHVDPEEVLSNNIYFYHADTRCMKLIE